MGTPQIMIVKSKDVPAKNKYWMHNKYLSVYIYIYVYTVYIYAIVEIRLVKLKTH